MGNRVILPAKAAERGYFCFVDADRALHWRSLMSDREVDADNRLVTYDETYAGLWRVEALGRSVVSLCRYRYPDRDRTIFVSLSSEGEVGFIGREEGFFERIPGAGMDAPDATRHGQMAKIRQIGARLYACGFGGQIYRREAADQWVAIDAGIRGPPTLDNTLSLDDIDGSSEQDIYVVGSRGYAAWFDGARWQRLNTPVTHNLHAILIQPGGAVWCAGQRGALLRGDHASGFVDCSDPGFTAEVLSLTWFDGRLHLGTRGGLAVLDGHRIVPVKTDLDPPLADAHMVDAVDGVLWVFGFEDVVRFDGIAWRRYPLDHLA